MELLFHVQRSISIKNLAATLNMRRRWERNGGVAEESCEKWVKEQIAKETLKVEIVDGFVKMAKPSSSVWVVCGCVESRYEQVMEMSKKLETRMDALNEAIQGCLVCL